MTAPPKLVRHDITVTSVKRRPYGLSRVVWIVRCACGWKRELGDSHTASIWTRHHRGGRA